MQIPIIANRGNIKPWTSIPRINWRHPLAHGLLFYHYDTGCGGYDLAGNRKWNLSSANRLPRKSSRWGTGYVIPNSTADGIKYTGDAKLRILSPMSWAAGFNRTVSATNGGNQFFCRSANSFAVPTVNWGIEDQKAGVTNAVDITFNNGGALSGSHTSVVLGLNAYHAVVGSSPNTSTIN